MRRTGAIALLPLLAACGGNEPTYTDGEEIAREVLKCDEVLDTSDTVAGPDTSCRLDGAFVTITEWRTTDAMRDTHIKNWQEADYATFDLGRDFTVFVPADEEQAVATIRERLG